MISKVFKKIDEAGIKTGTRLLCAVSGGIDSSVMLHVLNDFGFDCIVAHCNFKLRGAESDGDEDFVRHLSDKLEFKFLCERFDTHQYAEQTGLSIQMAARELRYNWFYEMAQKYNCSYIALAHNSDDQAETVITNLVRGTGIRGLTGMKFVKDMLFRPLLEISRHEIEDFAEANTIDFRTDSTNKTVKYSRNKIRHQILPLMEEINQSCKTNILKSVKYLSDTELILKAYVSEAANKCLHYERNKTVIDIAQLRKTAAPETVLFEILVAEGLPKSLAVESVGLLDAQTGKSCRFLNAEVLKDRDRLIIDKNIRSVHEEITEIDSDNLSLFDKYGIAARIIDNGETFKIVKDKNIAFTDFDKLKFPLIIRHWQDGDKFKPFGMKNFRKLSDFFIDEKLSMFDKNDVFILESAGEIVWLVGLRADNRFRIDENTRRILVLEKV